MGYYIYFFGEGSDSKVALFALSIARLVRADLTIKVYTNAHASTHVLWWNLYSYAYLYMNISIYEHIYIFTYKYDVYLHMRICVHMPHGFRYNILQWQAPIITISWKSPQQAVVRWSYFPVMYPPKKSIHTYTCIYIYIYIYKHIHMCIYI